MTFDLLTLIMGNWNLDLRLILSVTVQDDVITWTPLHVVTPLEVPPSVNLLVLLLLQVSSGRWSASRILSATSAWRCLRPTPPRPCAASCTEVTHTHTLRNTRRNACNSELVNYSIRWFSDFILFIHFGFKENRNRYLGYFPILNHIYFPILYFSICVYLFFICYHTFMSCTNTPKPLLYVWKHAEFFYFRA